MMEGVPGGLLGRTTFASKANPYLYRVIAHDLVSANNRIAAYTNPEIYKDIFKKFSKEELVDMAKIEGQYFGERNFWSKSFPTQGNNWKRFKTLDEYQEAVANAYNFRKNMVSKLYRQMSDFLQNDAMDRVSAKRLVYAINQAKKDGTSNEQILQMTKFVEEIKQFERAEKAKKFKDIITEEETVEKKDSDLLDKIFK